MNALIENLLEQGAVVTDGAWGTQLAARGLAVGTCPDAWNLSNPDRVEAVARAYVESGSEVILTNTFGANRITLAAHGLTHRAREINRSGSEIARRAAAGRARVFASMGPTGKMLAAGEVAVEDLCEAFAEQALALAEGGAEGIVVETMADLEEARSAVEAARATGLPVVACMVFDSGREGDRTMMGVTPADAAAELTAVGADVVGANCGRGIEGARSICRALKAATHRPVWIKPNAGLPELVDGRTVYRMTPDEFAAYATPLVEAGASFIGGCCGTGPEYIAALRVSLGKETLGKEGGSP